MQKLIALASLAITLCSGGAGALSTRGTSVRADAATFEQEWKLFFKVEAEDAQFWDSQWAAMETELLQLESATQPTNSSKEIRSHVHFNPLAGLKLKLNPKTAADLVPALAMLKGLYDDGKARIGKLNAREQESKQKFAAKQAEHEQRMATIDAQVRNGTVSKEFGANSTKSENRLWTYWVHCRERQHRQYHTSLKIQHGTLTKEKQMIDMYEKTIAGKESKKQLAKEFSKVGGPAVAPEVVLFETQRAIVQFCQAELVEVRTSRAALLQTDQSMARHDALQPIV